MDDQLKVFFDNLVRSQFSDLKGSWANLHLQVPEKLLNELLTLTLNSQKAANPWLALVSAAHAKGTVALEIKLTV
jgi:hypothetical protein